MDFYYHKHQNVDSEPAYEPKIYRLTKRWVIAQSRPNHQNMKMKNDNTEVAYHHVLLKVKKLYSTLDELVFEKDYKRDRSECIFAMHCFICNSFVFRLDCQLDFIYSVEYQFQDCPFEQSIRELLLEYPLPDAATEKQIRPDLPAFFQAVRDFQDDHHIYEL